MAVKENNQPLTGLSLEEALRIAERNGEKVVPTFCGMCGPGPFGCGIYAFVKDGHFVRVAGMKESPVNHGALCPKGQAAPQWVYSQDRLKYPMKRVGEKGEGRFERITWDEAIGIVADTLKRQKKIYGPESLAILSPARRSYTEVLQRFLTAHGSPNFGHSGICAMQRAFSFMYTFADWPGADVSESDLVIYWGRQPVFSAPAMDPPKMLVDAKKRGAKVIAIKPSVEPDVGMADIWVPIRPGTDAAFALAMLHVVVNEDLIDKPFVEKWCYGYDKLRDHVQQYSPEWAEKITGVPAGQIREVARLYATTKKAAIDLGNGVEHAPSASDAIRAVAILIAITGHLDRKGGNLFGWGPMGGPTDMPPYKDIMLRDRYTREMIDKLVGPEFPQAFQPFLEGLSSAYYRIFESVLTEKPYPIRAIISPGTQPAVSTRGSRHVIEALRKLDFYVVVDVNRTADMKYADIVIPVSSTYEWDHPFDGRNVWVMAYRQVIEPLGDYKSMHQFFLDLGVAAGYGEDFWQGDINAYINYQLEPFGITFDELKKYQTGIKFTPKPRVYEKYEQVFKRRSPRLTGEPFLPHAKVEIYNTSFEAAGCSPLPIWREPPEGVTATPELMEQYPLILADYHTSKNFTASWMRNVPILREISPDPVLHIHPDAASTRGIADGDWVSVTSPHGRIKVKAELYPGIRPDTVMLLHGWWQGCKELGLDDYPIVEDGANVNAMYSVDPEKAYDPLITAMSSQTLVEVRRLNI
jgi:anaerobic selenocysteine-containing dehydrogenase